MDVDWQFFKSAAGKTGRGGEDRQTSLERSACLYTVANDTPLAIDVARVDPILKSHPAVLDFTLFAYLGIPLIDRNDNAIDTLCVCGTTP